MKTNSQLMKVPNPCQNFLCAYTNNFCLLLKKIINWWRNNVGSSENTMSETSSDSDLAHSANLLEELLQRPTESQIIQKSQIEYTPTSQDFILENENNMCVRCWMLNDTETRNSQNLLKRYCPNCNQVFLVCSKHQKTYRNDLNL